MAIACCRRHFDFHFTLNATDMNKGQLNFNAVFLPTAIENHFQMRSSKWKSNCQLKCWATVD